MQRRVIAGMILALALGGGAQAQQAACTTPGGSGRALRLDPADVVAYVTWGHAMEAVLNPQVMAAAHPQVGCIRREFEVAGQTYTLAGENHDFFVRWAAPRSADRPSLFLARLPDLTRAVERRLGVAMRSTPGATYALVLLEDRQATAVRVYKGMPDDEILLEDITEALQTGGQQIARMARPRGELEIILSPPPGARPR